MSLGITLINRAFETKAIQLVGTIVRNKRHRSAFSSMPNGLMLHTELVIPKQLKERSGTAIKNGDGSILFLHGLLGNGRNLKTLATKVCEQDQQEGIIMDLRGHGKSLLSEDDRVSRSTTNSFENCVQDIIATLEKLQVKPTTLVGHSWGGRLALQYAATVSTVADSLERVWLLDTVPGQANESVERVVDAVTAIVKDQQNDEQNAFDRKTVANILTEQHGIDVATAQWLAMSYNTKSSPSFGFDLSVVHDLMPQFATQNFFMLLKQCIERNDNLRINLVQGGKNQAWTKDVLNRLDALQGSKFQMHLLPKAGHWVHVDDLNGLLDAMSKQ